MSISTVAKAFVEGAKAHRPEIMIGCGLIAGGGAIIMAVKETPACLEAFEQAEKEQPEIVEKNAEGEDVVVIPELTWKEKALIFGKHYWPAAALEALSWFLIIGGAKIRLDSYAKLLMLWGATKADLDDIMQVISEQPESWKKKFAEKTAESHLEHSNPDDIPAERMSDTEVPMALPLIWDDQAKVYFRISEEGLRDAIAEFTHMITTDPFQQTTMNAWMSLIDHEEVVDGDYRVMLADDPRYGDGPLKYIQVGVKEAPNGEPARVMKFSRDYALDTRGVYDNV